MEVRLFATFSIALVLSISATPLLCMLSKRYGLFIQADTRGVHDVPVSRVGGIAIALGILTSIIFLLPQDKTLLAYICGALIILVAGVWDDLSPLGYKAKFAGQLLASATVVYGGNITLERLPMLAEVFLPQWGMPLLTMVFFIGVINAVNLSDGLDGLAGGLCLLSAGGFATLGYMAGNGFVTVVAIAMVGAISGFLRFNTHPANVFMGDTGSQLLGFSLCMLVVILTQSTMGDYSLGISLFILGLPIIDMLGVILQRTINRQSPFLADRNHIHYKLLTIGFYHNESVVMVYFVHALMLCVAYLLMSEGEWAIWSVYTLVALPVLLCFVLSGLGFTHVCRLKRGTKLSFFRILQRNIISRRWLREKPFQFLEGGLYIFFLLSAFIPLKGAGGIMPAAAVLFVPVVMGVSLFRSAAPLLIRFGLYAASTVAVYLGARVAVDSNVFLYLSINFFFVLTAILVIVGTLVQIAEERLLRITSLDYPIIIVILLLSTLLKINVGGIEIGSLAAKLIILFMAYELILHRIATRIYRFGYLLIAVLVLLVANQWMV